MRTVGLITEYNPFHNGHRHHLLESLRRTGAEASVAVMSGHFLQRGEPALVDKWTRTRMALAAGVDLVLELPTVFACNSAPHFARAAVQSLEALGVVDALCFGSEAGEIERLDKVAVCLVENQATIEATTTRRLRDGCSYPVARAEALKALLPEQLVEQVASPNNILGIEYLCAMRQLVSRMEAFTIPRRGAGYHDLQAVGQIASASGIRQRLAEGHAVAALIPEECVPILSRALQAGEQSDAGRFMSALQGFLLQEPENLQSIYQVEQGLGRRLCEAAMTAQTYDELVDAIKSRHWTRTRIQRILTYVLLNLQAGQMNRFLSQGALYIRVLGRSERGRGVLARARRHKTLPIIHDPARAKGILKRFYRQQPGKAELAMAMLAADLRATRLYGLLQTKPRTGHFNQDYYRPVLGT